MKGRTNERTGKKKLPNAFGVPERMKIQAKRTEKSREKNPEKMYEHTQQSSREKKMEPSREMMYIHYSDTCI